MTKSNLQHYKSCYLCGSARNLESHHCLHGTANRKKADLYGLTVWLCHDCHMRLHDRDTAADRHLQQVAQKYFEDNIGTREDFRREFGKSYL